MQYHKIAKRITEPDPSVGTSNVCCARVLHMSHANNDARVMNGVVLQVCVYEHNTEHGVPNAINIDGCAEDRKVTVDTCRMSNVRHRNPPLNSDTHHLQHVFFGTCISMLRLPAFCEHIEHGLRLLSHCNMFSLERSCHPRGFQVITPGFLVVFLCLCWPSHFS